MATPDNSTHNLPAADSDNPDMPDRAPLEENLRIAQEETAKSQQELQEAQQLLDAFLLNNPALYFIKDEHGRYLHISQSFCTFFGADKAAIIGKTDLDLFPENIARQFLHNDNEVRETGKPVEVIESVPQKNAGVTHSIVHKFPIEMPGNRRFVGGVAVDITERKAVDELNVHLSALVESSNDAIMALTLAGHISSWNKGATKLFGYNAEEMIGKHFSILFPDIAPLTLQVLEIGLGHPLEEFELKGAHKNGNGLDLSLRISPINNGQGKIVGTSLVGRDIGKRRQDEERIKQLNSELEARCSELSDLNLALQSARDDALQASKIKSLFLANMSHELRTPLSAILGMNEMLLLSELDGEQKQLAQTVHASANNLLKLVNDLLDLSKIEAGKLSFKSSEFDIRETINGVLKTFSSEADQKGIKLSSEISNAVPAVLIGDPLRLSQILLNLIGNAIKFTSEGFVRLEIELEAVEEEMLLLQCRIVDSGIGIALDDLKLLFQPYSQLDAGSLQKVGGNGLGLAISKALVEMMGGRIQVQSEKGKGTTFSFLLKLRKKKVEDPDPEVGQGWLQDDIAAKILAKRKILVVEDNALMREVASRQLARFNVDIHTAEDGEEALEMFVTHRFDLILMDCQLPGISGFDVTEKIREKEKNTDSHVPIIALTASVMRGDAGRCINAGMDDFLSKPVSLQALKEKLIFWLSKVKLGS